MTEKQANAIRQFEKLAARLGSEKEAGTQIGVSSSIISRLRNEIYKGDIEKQYEKRACPFDTMLRNAGIEHKLIPPNTMAQWESEEKSQK